MRISVIGAGAMGGAFARGLLASGQVSGNELCVADPSQAVLDGFSQMGVRVTSCNSSAVKDADIVAVVVKPWLAETVIGEIKGSMDYSRQQLIVIAAGVTSGQCAEWLHKSGSPTLPPYYLVIPNIAIEILQSMTFIVPIGASCSQLQAVSDMFDKMGSSIVVAENLLKSGTTLASCGIAYALRYVRAAVEGGVQLGFKASAAQQIVAQTVKGAVMLMEQQGLHPEQLIDQVTTPGGVTIKGLNEMEHCGFTSAVINGLLAGAKD